LPTWTLSGGAEKQEALDLNCYLLVVERTLGAMARELGKRSEAKAFRAAADKRVRLMNAYMWDAGDGCYYGISEIFPDQKVNVKDISTLFPLWAGLAPVERADALIEHLHDPASLGAAYPVPTLARNEPLYGPRWHWHGSNWVEMTWLVILGLQRYGYYQEAARLAETNTRMVFDTIDKISHFREYFNTETGEGVDLYDYIWAAMPGIFITQILLGIEPTADGLRVMPALPEGWGEISIRSLKVRGRRVSVHVTRDPKATETRAKVSGRSWPAEDGRGVFVPWDQMGRRISVEIVQPARTAETHRPPWPLPDLDHPPVPPHARVRDQALIDATRADVERVRKELGK
jgi:glycogen debranching enzyme